MRNKLVIATFVLSILALAASGVSLLMYISDARGGSDNVQSAGAPPANADTTVTLYWPASVNDKYTSTGKVYYVDFQDIIHYLGPKSDFRILVKDGISYDSFMFNIDGRIMVKRIGVGTWLTKEQEKWNIVTMWPGDSFLIMPDEFIGPF